MATWTYSDYITLTTPSALATRLRLHIQEVSDKISADVSAHGYSRQSHPLIEYLKGLREELAAVSGAAAVGGGVALGRFKDAE